MNALLCRSCQKTYPLDDPRWRCDCGGVLDIHFEPHLDRAALASRTPSLWRYREALPLGDDRSIVSFQEGFTPLLPMQFDGRDVWIKQDHLFPTGSYKDRGATLLISKARELGIREVVEDSSGNAGCAVAAYCARAGIACTIYVPEDTAAGKLAQIQWYGARLVRVPGSREDTARAVMAAAQHIFYASHSWNPFFFQGTKTFAYEVCEQLGWLAPESVVLPAGNGTLLLGASIGFTELKEMGVIERIPRIIAVQSAACAPLAQAFAENLPANPPIQKGDTLAEGIAIADPIRGPQIVEAVRQSGGTFLTISEEEIRSALGAAARQGAFIEPTSAAVIAGLRQYLPAAAPDERIVSVFTGHGLKAAEKMLKLLEPSN
jgi:threonine synthase